MDVSGKIQRRLEGPKTLARRERFKKKAELRTEGVLRKLRVLEHCANPRLYEYSKEDLDKVFDAINQQVRDTRLQFNRHLAKKPFTLDE